METINISQMTEEQSTAWNLFYKNWLQTEFKQCLQSQDFKIDCIDCGSIYFDVQLEINKNGQIKQLKVNHEVIDCSNKTAEQIAALRTCILDTFEQNTLATSLRNLRLELRIGQVTKC